MSQFVNTNDLQQAIDEVANNSAAQQPEVEAIKDQMGVPPVPPAFDEVAPAAPAPVEAPVPAPEPVVNVAPAPVAEAVPAPSDLGAVKTEALRELVPLIDRVNLPAEQKFNMITDFITTTGDKSIAGSALAVARGIADENVKAESLLKLVQML